ncbi:TetR/AcrR family transcriptional regulator [Isobaculum melis]|uniref:Regulatory protein, tetR family n=1 Tax=Isobaculum melis TaxID=142588 RepID=A0A1H9SVG2_9LACT|nr:TetR/AcrR family transcriptional regulator C-terminal domain-containing protein [Isobaculum melis]SER88814.1 regulatory protein, tetR family [Isobaculum melis]
MSKHKLSREMIIESAFNYLQTTKDLKKLSMRKLAAELNVQAPALYWYFKNKNELLQALAETIAEALPFPDKKQPWQRQIEAACTNIFDIYHQFPCSPEIMMMTIPYTTARMRAINHFLELLIASGFSLEFTSHCVVSFNSYIMGAMMDLAEEKKLHAEVIKQDEHFEQILKAFKQQFEANDFSYMEKSFSIRKKISEKESFMTGIHLLIAGMEEHLSKEKQAKQS